MGPSDVYYIVFLVLLQTRTNFKFIKRQYLNFTPKKTLKSHQLEVFKKHNLSNYMYVNMDELTS